jgi:hypothetical protein
VKYVVSGSNCNRFGGCEQLDALMRVHKALEETNKKLTKELETRSVQEDKIRSKIQHELLHEHTIAKGKVAQAEELMAKALDQNAKLEVQTRQFELEREKLTALLEAAGNKLNVEQLRTHCCEVMAAIIAAEGESASAGEFDLHARVLTEVIADDLLRSIASRADYGFWQTRRYSTKAKSHPSNESWTPDARVLPMERSSSATCSRRSTTVILPMVHSTHCGIALPTMRSTISYVLQTTFLHHAPILIPSSDMRSGVEVGIGVQSVTYR